MNWFEPLAAWLVQSALLSSVTLICGIATMICCRQPARQIRVNEIMMAGCLLSPLLGFVPNWPQWSVARPIMAIGAESIYAAEDSLRSRSISGADSTRRVANSSAALVGGSFDASQDNSSVAVSFHELSDQDADERAVAVAQIATSNEPPFGWHTVIVISYGVGLSLTLVWWMAGFVALIRLLRTAKPVSADCRDLLREIAGPNIDRVALLSSDRLRLPIAVSLRRSAIILPERLADSNNGTELRWCLAHEWSNAVTREVGCWPDWSG